MNPKVVLCFDMDNTLCDTQLEVLDRIETICVENGFEEELNYLKEVRGKISLTEFKGNIVKLIHEHVIEKRVYMDTAKPTVLMEQLGWLLKSLKSKFSELKVVVCSHRGDNCDAWMSTFNYLQKHQVGEYFDMIHSIDHVINKDKIVYLKRMYPESKILLVDDNPFGSKSVVREKVEEVLIFDLIDQFDSHKNQAVYNGIEDLYSRVESMFS